MKNEISFDESEISSKVNQGECKFIFQGRTIICFMLQLDHL